MRLLRNLHSSPKSLRDSGCVVVIGNFDGLHLGHSALIRQAKTFAQLMQLPVCVITFEPNPTAFFCKKFGKPAPFKLQRFRDKATSMQEHGVDYLCCLKFNTKLAELSASDFLDKITEHLGAKHFYVGHDFHFGKDKQGDTDLIQDYADLRQQSLFVMPPLMDSISQQRVSSSYIRHLLADGDLIEAARLLGRHYSLTGKVIYGAQLGRTLGFRTANISLARLPLPLHGVYVVCVTAIENEATEFFAVASVGTNPTVTEANQKVLEIHLLDYADDLYGKRLTVEFIEKIRDEQKFADLTHLIRAIETDIEIAQNHILKDLKRINR